MNVLLFNGSPHARGCTHTALSIVAERLQQHGIQTEILQVQPARGCMGCKACTKLGKCAFSDDNVNEILEKCKTANGFVLGSPVHYASASGQATAFFDRLFQAGRIDNVFAFKPGAAIVTLRRGGATAALDQLQKYFTISNMPIVSSQYWNMVHGNTPDELLGDAEGLQVLRALGENMAWLLACIEAGKQAGILPKPMEIIRTNFIR